MEIIDVKYVKKNKQSILVTDKKVIGFKVVENVQEIVGLMQNLLLFLQKG